MADVKEFGDLRVVRDADGVAFYTPAGSDYADLTHEQVRELSAWLGGIYLGSSKGECVFENCSALTVTVKQSDTR